jgi:hypothetical protein
MIPSDNQLLMNAIGFTADDLNVNRNGVLSEQQRAKIGRTQGWQRLGGLLMLVIVIVMLAAIFVYVFFFSDSGASLRASLQEDPTSGLIVGVALVVIVAIIGGSFLRAFARTRRLGTGEVKSVTGIVKRHSYTERVALAGEITGYQIKIGKMKFYVEEKVFSAFRDDGTYTIYYVENPPVHVILSAETTAA